MKMNNLTPKEKSKEIVDKFFYNNSLDTQLNWDDAKFFALIAVDEILKSHLYDEEENHYYIEVKKEIEKL